jgi:hypothetical protein
MNSPGLKRAVTSVLALLLLAFVGYQIFRTHYTPIRTETAVYFTASDSLQTSVVALRKETVLSSPQKGALDYTAETGSKVAKGGTVARVYENESQISAQHQLEEINSTMSQLKSLQQQGNVYSFNVDTVNNRICTKLTEILREVRSGNMAAADNKRDSLLELLNEKQLGTGQVKNFSARISALEAQCKTLEKQAGSPVGTVVSPISGYFIQSADGMENAYDVSKIGSITSDDVKRLQAMKETSVSAAGKICSDFDWYLVCSVSGEQFTSFRQLGAGNTVSIRFPFVSETTVSGVVETVNPSSDGTEAAVVIRCKDMNSELAGIRHETADLTIGQYTGLRVSQQAIHYAAAKKTVKDAKGNKSTVQKEVEGVYVLHGNQLVFRQIVPKFSTDGYVICETSPDTDSLYTSGTVKYSDEVVVEGTDLYDGKVVK